MKSLRQLLRQPVKSLAGVLLLALAGGLLCANAGQYAAAVRTRRQIETDYTTAALTTDKFQWGTFDGITGRLMRQPQKVQDFLNGIETTYFNLIRRVDRLGLISGYCPAVIPLNYVQAPHREYSYSDVTAYTAVTNEPYTTAVLAVTLEETGPVEDQWGSVTASLVGRVDQVVLLQEGYQDPTGRTLRFTVSAQSEEEIVALNLRVGERYLIYGDSYTDTDWQLRRELMTWKLADSIEAVDWNELTLVEDIEDADLLESIPFFDSLNNRKTAAVYGGTTHAENPHYISESQLDMVNACTMSVHLSPAAHYHYQYIDYDFNFHNMSELIAHMETEEYQAAERAAVEEFNERYREPSISYLGGTVEELLNSPEGELWKGAMEQADICNHALPVLTTPRLESVVQFVRGDAVIAQGRSFTEEEYTRGSRVCVLSESLAAANGLSVGEHIPLTLYCFDSNYEEPSNYANPVPTRYSPVRGFAALEEEYEIVGLYRQTDEWREGSYDFLPNTVFVPAQAVTAETWASDSGIFQTVVLRNGAQEEMEALLKEAELEGLFVYYDQGYSKIAGHLADYFKNAQTALIAGVAAWVVIFLLFLFLFPLSQRKSAQRMWALGATSGQIRGHVLLSAAGLAVPGTVLGGILSSGFLRGALERAAAETGLALRLEPWIVPALAAAQLLCCLTAAFLCGVFLARAGKKKGGG